jgi:hypothetical protein
MDALTLLKNPTTAMPDQALAVPAVRVRPSAETGKGISQIVIGRFKITEKGVFLVTPGDDDKPDKFEFVCGKLDVVAMIRDQHSGQWGKLLQWEDPDGQPHEWAMPMAALQGDGAEVRRELAAGGLEISQTFKLRGAPGQLPQRNKNPSARARRGTYRLVPLRRWICICPA